MPSPRFEELKSTLLGAGVAPIYIQRTLLELSEHYDDLERDALAAGLPAEDAAERALATLGSQRAIAEAVLCRPELRVFAHRWPRVALCFRSAVLVALLPAAPFMFCADRGPSIARWGLSVALAMVVTGSMLFSLQLFIAAA